MIEQYLTQLVEELQLEPLPPKDDQDRYHLRINTDLEISFNALDPGFFVHSLIAACPKQKREELFIYLAKANFLGQGTGGGCIGLEENENFLTLSLSLPYDMNYKAFKETVEDFVNHVDYWKEEISRHEQAAKSILE